MGTRGDGRAREHTLRALARTPHAAYHRGFCARRRQIRLHSARSTLRRRRIGVGAEMGAGPPRCAKAGAASPRPPSPSPARPGAHLAACSRSPTQTRKHKPGRLGQRTRDRMSQPHRPIEAALELQIRFFERRGLLRRIAHPQRAQTHARTHAPPLSHARTPAHTHTRTHTHTRARARTLRRSSI